jgi:hypothetical protein
MIGKVIVDNNKLYFEKEDKSLLLIINANEHPADKNFYLIHGWYSYPEPIDLEKSYEIEVINEKTCRIIKQCQE